MISYDEWRNQQINENLPSATVDQNAGVPIKYNKNSFASDMRKDITKVGNIGGKSLEAWIDALQKTDPAMLRRIGTLLGLGGEAITGMKMANRKLAQNPPANKYGLAAENP
jgi:hypothetical protein